MQFASSDRSFSSASLSSSGLSSPGPSVSVRGLQRHTRKSSADSFESNATATLGTKLRPTLQPVQRSSRRRTPSGGFKSPSNSAASRYGLVNTSPEQTQSLLKHVVPAPSVVSATTRPEDVNLMNLLQSDQDGTSVDTLFVHFAVREVRSIEDRARSDAGAKREELRTMVGERYRDLLSAADSIVRMRKSSTSLLGGLESVAKDCARCTMLQRAKTCALNAIAFNDILILRLR